MSTPGRRHCIVPQCDGNKTSKVSMHRFPQDKKLANKWKRVLKINKPITKSMYVCSKHFRKNDFTPATSNYPKVVQRKRIVPGAIPSLNLSKQLSPVVSPETSDEEYSDISVKDEYSDISVKEEYLDEDDPSENDVNEDDVNDDNFNYDDLKDDDFNDDDFNDDDLNDDDPNDDDLNDDNSVQRPARKKKAKLMLISDVKGDVKDSKDDLCDYLKLSQTPGTSEGRGSSEGYIVHQNLILPGGYRYSYLKQLNPNEHQFFCAGLENENAIQIWVDKYGEIFDVDWQLAKRFPTKGEKCFYKIYKCQVTSCESFLFIRRILPIVSGPDQVTTVVLLKNRHNHEVKGPVLKSAKATPSSVKNSVEKQKSPFSRKDDLVESRLEAMQAETPKNKRPCKSENQLSLHNFKAVLEQIQKRAEKYPTPGMIKAMDKFCESYYDLRMENESLEAALYHFGYGFLPNTNKIGTKKGLPKKEAPATNPSKTKRNIPQNHSATKTVPSEAATANVAVENTKKIPATKTASKLKRNMSQNRLATKTVPSEAAEASVTVLPRNKSPENVKKIYTAKPASKSKRNVPENHFAPRTVLPEHDAENMPDYFPMDTSPVLAIDSSTASKPLKHSPKRKYVVLDEYINDKNRFEIVFEDEPFQTIV